MEVLHNVCVLRCVERRLFNQISLWFLLLEYGVYMFCNVCRLRCIHPGRLHNMEHNNEGFEDHVPFEMDDL